MTSQGSLSPPELLRWYIDTRKLSPTSTATSTSSLPLLSTLQPQDQEKVTKFYHLADRQMSLASNLLKYLFVHRTCKVPWPQITISRTPAPHHRPCYVPNSTLTATTAMAMAPAGPQEQVEFNVSHQASLVALAGTVFYTTPDCTDACLSAQTSPPTSKAPVSKIPQVGIDITCVNEPSRNGRSRSRSESITTRKALAEHLSIFSEVFSQSELETIKEAVPPPPPPPRPANSEEEERQGTTRETENEKEREIVSYRLRLFYTYWALKEAYIKMTGEALLAPWLRQLEFRNVVAPSPPPLSSSSSPPSSLLSSRPSGSRPRWGPPLTDVETYLHGRKVEDVRIEVAAFEEDYLVATAARGPGIGPGGRDGAGTAGSSIRQVDDPWKEMEEIDVEEDIAPCARGECNCLGKS